MQVGIYMHVYMYMQNCQSCEQYNIIMAFNAIFEPKRTVPFTGHVTIDIELLSLRTLLNAHTLPEALRKGFSYSLEKH